MAIPLIIAPVAILAKFNHAKRQLEHAERMRALEVGRTLPQDEPWWSPPKIAVAIGAGVPLGIFAVALVASAILGYHQDIWMAAMAPASCAIICGTVIAARYLTHRERTLGTSGDHLAKPAVDEEAYDFVGSRN